MLRITPVLVLLLVGAISLPMEPATVTSQNDEVVGFYRNTTEGFSIRLLNGWVGQENENNFPLLSVKSSGGSSPIIAEVWVHRRLDDRSAGSWLMPSLSNSNPTLRTAVAHTRYRGLIRPISLSTIGYSMTEPSSLSFRRSSPVAPSCSSFASEPSKTCGQGLNARRMLSPTASPSRRRCPLAYHGMTPCSSIGVK